MVFLRPSSKIIDYSSVKAQHEQQEPGSKRCKRDKCKASKQVSVKVAESTSPSETLPKEVTTDDIYNLLQRLHSYDKEQIANQALDQVYQATGSNQVSESRQEEGRDAGHQNQQVSWSSEHEPGS